MPNERCAGWSWPKIPAVRSKGRCAAISIWGAGNAAGDRAGAMDARGRYFLLLPRRLAARNQPSE